MGVYLGQSVYNDSQVTPEWVEEEIANNGKGVFFATYGQTTYQNILQEYNNGKIIVCKYEPATPGETTTYYFNLVRFNTETFDFVGVMRDGTIYRTGINSNEGWENVTTLKLDEIEFVEYNVDSYSTIKSYYDYGKFIVLKYMQQTPLDTKYYFYPLVSVDETNKEIVFGSLELGRNNKKINFTVTDSTGWAAPAESPAVVVDVALDSSSHNPVENMAIAAQLTEINNKITGDLNDIFLALASKGVTVPAGAGLDDVAGLIDDIPTGGGGDIPVEMVGFESVENIAPNGDNNNIRFQAPFTNVKKFECDFWCTNAVGFSGNLCSIFGISTTTDTSSNANFLSYVRFAGQYDYAWSVFVVNGDPTGKQISLNNIPMPGDHKIILDGPNISLDGNTLANDVPYNPINGNLYFWPAGFYRGYFQQGFTVKRLKIYDTSNNLVYEFTPCKRKYDNMLGMFSKQYGPLLSGQYVTLTN